MTPSSERARSPEQDFDLEQFLPYLLNQAAEATSRSFQRYYSMEYGMTRTQWRVLANLGKFGAMTAKDICRISHIEKTKVSRAIAALEEQRFLVRKIDMDDRRAENLSLTKSGLDAFDKLGQRAIAYDEDLREQLGVVHAAQLVTLLKKLATNQTEEWTDH